MARLIIIGNGYDLAHLKNKTSYKDFSEWLCNKYQLDINGNNKLYFHLDIPTYNGTFLNNLVNNNKYNINIKNVDESRKELFSTMLVNMIADLNDKKWSDFENDLGKLDWNKYIDEANKYYGNYCVPGSPVSYGTDLITSASRTIMDLFIGWIESIDIYDVKKDYIDKKIGNISNNDYFLIFNYTNTVEKVFLIPKKDNLCYIHGTASNGNNIVVGHGDINKSGGSNLDNDDDYIKEAEAALYKNTEQIFENHQAFFDNVKSDFCSSEYNEIFVYGWNCSDSDKYYLTKIINIVNGNYCTLYLNNYDGDGVKKEQLWKANGFKGTTKLISHNYLAILLNHIKSFFHFIWSLFSNY